jgi:hypothetical protein
MQSIVLPGCCVSRYVTFHKDDNDLLRGVNSKVLDNGDAVAIAVLDPKANSNFFDAFTKCKIPYEKLGNGQVLFSGTGTEFKDACNYEALRPIIEWEKKEGRKRRELRVGDLIDVSLYLGAGHEGRVSRVLPNRQVTFTVTKASRGSAYPVGRHVDNYGTGIPNSYATIILPQAEDGTVKDNDK